MISSSGSFGCSVSNASVWTGVPPSGALAAGVSGLMGVTGWPVKGLKAANDTGKGSR